MKDCPKFIKPNGVCIGCARPARAHAFTECKHCGVGMADVIEGDGLHSFLIACEHCGNEPHGHLHANEAILKWYDYNGNNQVPEVLKTLLCDCANSREDEGDIFRLTMIEPFLPALKLYPEKNYAVFCPGCPR